jgi:hypothetical protein
MGIFGNLFKPMSQSEEQASASARILARLKERRGEETGKWLGLMQDPTKVPPPAPTPTVEDVDQRDIINEAPYSPPLETQYTPLFPEDSGKPAATATRAKPKANETVEWVNKLFDEFARQASQFNATASGTDVTVTVHAPEFTYESPDYAVPDPELKISVFKGHIATLHWAMLVQGYNDKIQVYVIAADEILNFTLNDIRKADVSPFMTIESTLANSHRVWNVGGTTIGFEIIPLLAKELLGDLIRIASGRMDESELFAHHTVPLKLGETVAQGFSPVQQTAPPAPVQDAAPRDIASLASWSACDRLLQALDQDLAWMTSRLSALDPSTDQKTVQILHDLSGRMRTLSGEVSSLLAEYHPAAGSKYNAS